MVTEPGMAFETVQKEYLDRVLNRVVVRAKELASEDGRDVVNHVDAVRAFESHFGVASQPIERKPPWHEENAFLLIIVIMTIVFGAMGLVPSLVGADASKLGYQPSAFLDMSKLFAGVLVGGAAGATAANAAKTRSKGA